MIKKNPALAAYRRTKKNVKSEKMCVSAAVEDSLCRSCKTNTTMDVKLEDGRDAEYCIKCRVTMPKVDSA